MAKILIVSPYQHVFPPLNGGHLRISNLTAAISRHHETHYLSLQANAAEQASLWDNARCSQIHFHHAAALTAPNIIARYSNAIKYRWYAKKCSAPTNSAVLSLIKEIKPLLQDGSFDCIVLISTPPIILQAFRKKYSIPIIYDAHNVDSTLTKQQLDLNSEHTAQLQQTYQAYLSKETTLHAYSDAVFACSQIDQQQLLQLNQNKLPVFSIPNGVDSQAHPFIAPSGENKDDLLFCGSLDYFPNKEGLLWFHQNVWPRLKKAVPEVTLTIIGRTKDPSHFDTLKDDPQINLVGAVDTVLPYYRKATIAIVPLNLGSGTRLKILESMSLGTPVISTSQGAEGIEAEHQKEILIADKAEDFLSSIVELLKKTAARKEQSIRARALIETKYDWQVIGKQADAAIQQLIRKTPRSLKNPSF